MHITNVSDAKAQLSALIEKVLAGEEVIIGIHSTECSLLRPRRSG